MPINTVESDSAGEWEAVMKAAGMPFEELVPLSSKGQFLKLAPRLEPYRIRLVSVPKVARRHWEAFKEEKWYPVSPSIRDGLKEADVAWSLGGWKPGARFTAVVMDRECGKPRIMEFGRMLFLSFTEFMEGTGIDPAGRQAPDFGIMVSGQDGANMSKRFRLLLGPRDEGIGIPAPLTDQEMSASAGLLKIVKTGSKAVSSAEIRDKWMALPKERKYSPAAVLVAKSRNGYGKTQAEDVRMYIEKYCKDIFVPVLDKGLVVHAPISDMDPQWASAYASYWIDFGILPNRYLSEERQTEEMVDRMLDTDDVETRWIDPNKV